MIDPAEEARAQAFEQMTDAQKEAAIATTRAEGMCYGICQACGFKLVARGKDWPTSCPGCGHGS